MSPGGQGECSAHQPRRRRQRFKSNVYRNEISGDYLIQGHARHQDIGLRTSNGDAFKDKETHWVSCQPDRRAHTIFTRETRPSRSPAEPDSRREDCTLWFGWKQRRAGLRDPDGRAPREQLQQDASVPRGDTGIQQEALSPGPLACGHDHRACGMTVLTREHQPPPHGPRDVSRHQSESQDAGGAPHPPSVLLSRLEREGLCMTDGSCMLERKTR